MQLDVPSVINCATFPVQIERGYVPGGNRASRENREMDFSREAVNERERTNQSKCPRHISTSV
jgi:hypothetical protein